MAANDRGYTGGAFDATIPDSYSYEDYKADFNECAPFLLCMLAGDEYQPFADELGMLMMGNEGMMEAFGRMTAYMERNKLDELFK